MGGEGLADNVDGVHLVRQVEEGGMQRGRSEAVGICRQNLEKRGLAAIKDDAQGDQMEVGVQGASAEEKCTNK